MTFREFETTSGKKVLAGKSAVSNEELIEQLKTKKVRIIYYLVVGGIAGVFALTLTAAWMTRRFRAPGQK